MIRTNTVIMRKLPCKSQVESNNTEPNQNQTTIPFVNDNCFHLFRIQYKGEMSNVRHMYNQNKAPSTAVGL